MRAGTERQRVVIIGAGVAGLATAGLLARDGHQVTVLEQQQQVGGRAGRLEDDGFRWDQGPSWWLMPEAFGHFYALMGTSVERELDLRTLEDPSFALFTEGFRRLDITTGAPEVASLFEDLEPGAGHRLVEDLAAWSDDYQLALGHFLYTNFEAPSRLLDPSVLRRVPRLLTRLTRSLERQSVRRYRDLRLRQLLDFPAVFLSSSPSRTPAFYGILNHTILNQGVAYPMGGFGTFVDSLHRLALDAGAEIITGAAAQQITCEKPRRHATGVTYRDVAGTEHHLFADLVVSAVDRQFTETVLLPDPPRSVRRRWQRRDPGIGCVLAYLGVQGPLPELAHHSLFFSREWSADFQRIFPERGSGAESHCDSASRSVYLCRPSATDESVAPPGHENLFLLIPVPAMAGGIRGSLHGSPDVETEEIVDRTVAMIAERAGIADMEERIVARHTVGPGDFEAQFNSWQGGALGLAHTLRQSAFLRGSNRSREVDGLYFAGATTTPGVGLPMCLISAENVLKRFRADTTVGPLPVPVPTRAGDHAEEDRS